MSHLRLGLLGILLVFGVQWTLSVISTALAAGLVATALMFLILLATTGCGRLALRSVGPSGLSESEKTLIGATLGLGLLSQGTFLLGIAGLLRPWAAGALLCAFWIVGFTELRDAFRSLGANWNLWRERPVFAAALLGLIAAVFWTSWVPPHQYDSLVYHLALPAAYLRAGKITAVGHLLYSYFPQNGEMLFAVGLLLGSDLVAQMFSWLAFLLSAAWVFEISKREMPLTAALLACGLLASHTAVMLLAAVTYVETMAMLWVTASVLAFFRWSEIPDEPAGRGWLVLSAIFAGLGIGTKYYVGICPAALCLMLAVRTAFIRRRTEGPGASAVFSFAGIVAACAAPWLLRNAFTVGNPFFPFFYSLLPHRGVPWAQENAQGYFRMLTEYGHPEGWLMELLKFPFRIASGSLRFGGGMDVLGGVGWGVVFAALPTALLVVRRNRFIVTVSIYCAIHAAAWFGTGVVLRFLVVIAPLLSIVSAAGLYQLWSAVGRRGRAALSVGLGLGLTGNVFVFFHVHTFLRSWDVLSGIESREAFLAKKLDYYPCARHAREHLGKNDKILMVGEQRGYYVAQNHAATTPMAPNGFVLWANEAATPLELSKKLKSEGFKHLLFVPREARRLAGYGVFAFTDAGRRNWAELESKHTKPAYSSGACSLVELL